LFGDKKFERVDSCQAAGVRKGEGDRGGISGIKHKVNQLNGTGSTRERMKMQAEEAEEDADGAV